MFRKIMLAVSAVSVASCMSAGILRAEPPTPELVITPGQAKELFGDLEAKMIVHYAPGEDPDPGKEMPLFLIDFSEVPFRFQLICEDIPSWHGDPFISPDGTRLTYDSNGKVYVRELKPGGPGKTLVGEGHKPRWWFHPNTGDEYVIFTNRRWNNNNDLSGTTYIRKLRKGTCEPQGEVEILVEKYALGEGRSPDGRYICGTQPGCAVVELKPEAVKDAFVRVVWSMRRQCNGSIIQDPKFSGKFCWLDERHGRIITGPDCELGDIFPPPPNKSIQWSEWSTHPDYLSASPSVPDEWVRPDIHDICIYQVSKKKWTTVAHKGRSSHLWVYTSRFTVSIASPKNGANFLPGSNISITANPVNPEGTVVSVDFYQGSTKLGEAASAPWTYTWNAAVLGVHSFTAVATDDAGRQNRSTPVSITVGKLTGTVIGTDGSYQNDPAYTKNKVFDGETGTWFDSGDGSGSWCGLDLGADHVIRNIRYYPREGFEFRMTNGKFQGSSTADFSSGVVDLYTVSSQPALAWNEAAAIENTDGFRYVRYVSPIGGYGNIAECELYGYVP